MTHSSNQQHSRKPRSGSSSVGDVSTPSKAPGQDEDGTEKTGSSFTSRHAVNPDSGEQGISNRPVRDEHAFPDPPASDADEAPASVDVTPKQQGGPRGGV